jgi:DNA-binding CsgD family transcriptional regulator
VGQRRRWENLEERLTPRQREVLLLIAQGKRMKEVGNCLEISFRTVLFHKDQIMAKIGARSQADLVKYALRGGMLAAKKYSLDER